MSQLTFEFIEPDFRAMGLWEYHKIDAYTGKQVAVMYWSTFVSWGYAKDCLAKSNAYLERTHGSFRWHLPIPQVNTGIWGNK